MKRKALDGAPISETHVAAAAVNFLENEGWTVYREVRDGYGGARADLVGERGGATFVVECKTRLSLDVIEQAHAWLGRANQIAVAVPMPQDHYARLPLVVLSTFGLGLLTVSHPGAPYASVRVDLPARWRRARENDRGREPVRKLLHEEQRTLGVAGSKEGGYVTEWRLTMIAVAKYVLGHPGCSVRQCMDAVDHHYATSASARQGLVFALRGGLCPGVEARDGKAGYELHAVPVAGL